MGHRRRGYASLWTAPISQTIERAHPLSYALAAAKSNVLGAKKPGVDCSPHQLDERVDAEFLENPRAMRLDRLAADAQGARDGRVAVAVEQKLQDLALAPR